MYQIISNSYQGTIYHQEFENDIEAFQYYQECCEKYPVVIELRLVTKLSDTHTRIETLSTYRKSFMILENKL